MKYLIILSMVSILLIPTTFVDEANGERWGYFGEIRENGLSDGQITSMLILVIFGIVVSVIFYLRERNKKK